MVVLEPRLVLLHIIELVMLSILFGIGASWCWVLWSLLKGQRLLPDTPLVTRRKTPWGSGSVLLVFLLYLAVNLLLFQGYVLLTGRTPGEGPPAAPAGTPGKAVEKPNSQDGKPVAATLTEDDRAGKSDPRPASPEPPGEARKDAKEFSLLELMSIQAVVNTLLLVLLPLVLRLTSGARLRDFGLSLDQWGRQVTLGVVAVLFLMPIIFGTQWCAFRLLGPFDEQFRHPVERMLREQFTGVAAGVAFFTAVVLAPLFEELMFRGIFQSWLIELLDRFRSHFGSRPVETMGPSECVFLPSEFEHSTPDPEFQEESTPANENESLPARPAGLDPGSREWAPEFWVADDRVADPPKSKTSTPQLPSPISAGPAIIVTSLIFASLHAGQWPAPIPIFFLALGLGLVYYRTGSLLAVICMHAVFNASSTLALIFALLAGVPAGGDRKVPPPAIERNMAVEKVKPGAQNVDQQPD